MKRRRQMILGVGRRGETHALLVLPAIKRHLVAHGVKRLSETGHVAVTENAKATAADARLDPVDLDELVHQVAHDGLRHR
jgi:hypothetical protein